MNIESASTTVFSGIGFSLEARIVHFYIPSGFFWGWSFLIPAFACLGHGVGHYMQWKENQKQQQYSQPVHPHQINQPDSASQIIATATSKISPPENSVTETTTRHLDIPQRPE